MFEVLTSEGLFPERTLASPDVDQLNPDVIGSIQMFIDVQLSPTSRSSVPAYVNPLVNEPRLRMQSIHGLRAETEKGRNPIKVKLR
jgi:hypothetical protein